jgi:hypothetical protein
VNDRSLKGFREFLLAATKRPRRDHSRVEQQHEIDDAIDIAIDRTKDAQGRFAEEMESAGVPDPGSAGVVVRRAEDLDVLAHDRKSPTADDPDDDPDDEAAEPNPPSS